MGFAMRMKFADIIKPDGFRPIYINGKKQGFSFDMQLAYYRGHYLSDIDCFEVLVDGEKMAQEGVTLELNGKEFTTYQFAHAETEFWSQVATATVNVLKPGGLAVATATVNVLKPGGLAAGEHELTLNLMLRIPYMAIGPQMYMPLDSGDTVKFTL